MKTHELDIANFLSSYSVRDVKKGIRLWATERVAMRGGLKKELRNQGWYPVKEKPQNREYYEIDGEYWVQDPEVHRKMVDELRRIQLERLKVKKAYNAKYNAQDKKTDLSDIQKTGLKCPICNGILYKQPICPGCGEGRKGFRIRLICDEDADHEFLL